MSLEDDVQSKVDDATEFTARSRVAVAVWSPVWMQTNQGVFNVVVRQVHNDRDIDILAP